MDTYVTQIGTVWGNAVSELQKPLCALILLVCIDYITGICVAVREKNLSSQIGAKGLTTKVMIFAMVGLSVVVDQLLIGVGLALSSVTILFYCSNELISICENAAKMGIPMPQKLTAYLKNFQNHYDKDKKDHEK